MESKIEKLCRFASSYFGIEERSLYSRCRNDNVVTARHIIWYYMHYEYGLSAGFISKEFLKKRRSVWHGISKIKNGIKTQKYYREIYNKFIEEYKKKAA